MIPNHIKISNIDRKSNDNEISLYPKFNLLDLLFQNSPNKILYNMFCDGW